FAVIKNAQLQKMEDLHYQIIGYDISQKAVDKAQKNIDNAGLSDFIQLFKADFFTSEKYTERPLQMVFNPPYGERMAIDIPSFYQKIGDTLKQHYPGTDA